jgi:ribosomal-protein-alanine N-acetyltransferase
MKCPDIKTSRLDIKQIHIDYCDTPFTREVVGWINNPLIVRFSELRHRRHTCEGQERYINSFKDGSVYLGIWYAQQLIGTLSVHMDAPNKTANVGILIGDHARWGMGFGLEAWNAVVDRLLDEDVRKVETGCMSCNISMMSICHRSGMVEEGRQEGHFLYHDVPMDLVHWGKSK